MTKRIGTARINTADLDLFSAASHDRNPLHVSEAYARRTPYGERVVHGVLGVIAVLAWTGDRPDMTLSGIKVTFRQPLFVGVDYRVEVDEPVIDTARVRIFDAERVVMTATMNYGSASMHQTMALPSGIASRSEPVDRDLKELGEGFEASGVYAPSVPDVLRLMDRWQVSGKGVAGHALTALLWCSYVVGMEVPGRRALFWSLDMQIDTKMNTQRSGSAAPFAYCATVAKSNVPLEYVDVAAELSAADHLVASATIRAFVRQESPVSNPAAVEALLPRSATLRGKLAVVVGGSRGLGAAIVQALAAQECAVVAIYRESSDDAERIRQGASAFPGAVEMIQGNAADDAWCRGVLYPLVASRGGVDILVCNASPAIRPLNLSLEEMQRFRVFASTSLDLVAVPMAALLESLCARVGCCVLISSSFVRELPPDWPHYIAAKSAAEGLVSWAAGKYKPVRFMIARPPRLLTDQMNTPAGRLGALPVERAAAAIVTRICNPAAARSLQLLEAF